MAVIARDPDNTMTLINGENIVDSRPEQGSGRDPHDRDKAIGCLALGCFGVLELGIGGFGAGMLTLGNTLSEGHPTLALAAHLVGGAALVADGILLAGAFKEIYTALRTSDRS